MVVAVMQPGTDVPSLLFTCITHMCVYMSADTHAHAHVQALTLTPVLTADFSAPPLLCLPHHLLLPCSSQSPCQPLTPRFPPSSPRSSLPTLSPSILGLRQVCGSPPSSLVTLACLAAGIAIRLVYNAL